MDPNFDKAHEIYFRLGIIYKQQQKYSLSLDVSCMDPSASDLLTVPSASSTLSAIPQSPSPRRTFGFRSGMSMSSKESSKVRRTPIVGCLHMTPSTQRCCNNWAGFITNRARTCIHRRRLLSTSRNRSEQVRTRVICDGIVTDEPSDGADAHSWYLLGRCYMTLQRYPRAYEAYQQAVYRDGKNPTFWCSIGVLYYQINQYRDALDAYSRAIRLNPNISEVWYDLGTLVSCCFDFP